LEVFPVPIEGISYSTTSFKVHCESKKLLRRPLSNVVIDPINTPPSKELELFPSKVDLVLRGGINKLGKLSNDSIKVYVDFLAGAQGEHRVDRTVIRIPAFTSNP